MFNLITANYNGKLQSHTLEKWAEILGMHKKTLVSRRCRGFTNDELVNVKPGESKKNYHVGSKEQIEQAYQAFCFKRGDQNNAV